MSKMFWVLAVPLALALPAPVMAQPTAGCCGDYKGTVVNLQAEARRMVPQDRVMATLMIEKQANTPAEVQSFINGKMQDARVVYGKFGALKVSTGGYNVWKEYRPQPDGRELTPAEQEKLAYWRATQTLLVDGADKDAVLKVVGALQLQGFAVQGLNYYLSREAGDKLKDSLMLEAMETVKTRARLLADNLGLKSVRFANIGFDGNMPYPPMMERAYAGKAMAMADGVMPEPVVQAGESEVTVTVNVEVRME